MWASMVSIPAIVSWVSFSRSFSMRTTPLRTRYLPDTGRLVETAREQLRPVGAEGDGADQIAVFKRRAKRATVDRAPQPCGLVGGCAHDASPVGTQRHGIDPISMPREDSHESGGFAQGSPTKDETRVSEFGEPVFGFLGQGRLPLCHGPKQDLLGEGARLTRSVPLPEKMVFPLEQAEHGEETISNTVVRVGGEVQGRHEALLVPVDAVGLNPILQGGEVLKRLGDAAGTGSGRDNPEPRPRLRASAHAASRRPAGDRSRAVLGQAETQGS